MKATKSPATSSKDRPRSLAMVSAVSCMTIGAIALIANVVFAQDSALPGLFVVGLLYVVLGMIRLPVEPEPWEPSEVLRSGWPQYQSRLTPVRREDQRIVGHDGVCLDRHCSLKTPDVIAAKSSTPQTHSTSLNRF